MVMLINCSIVVDHWLVCFHSRSNSCCESSSNYNGDACIQYDGAWIYATDSEYNEDIYICDEYHHDDNSFVCEVCDLSGYGILDYISDDMIEGILSSQFETDGKNSGGIAFRCHDAYHTHEFWRPLESLSSLGESGNASNLEILYRNETRTNAVSPDDCVHHFIIVYLILTVKYLFHK